MNKLGVICWFIIIINVLSVDVTPTDIRGSVMAINTVLKLLKNRNEKEMTTSDIKKGDGFKTYNNVIFHDERTVRSIEIELERLKSSSIFENINPNIKENVNKAINEINDNVIFDPYFNRDMFKLLYQDMNGVMNMVKLYIEKTTIGYRIDLIIVDVNFIPSNSHVILSYSNSDIFSRTFNQEIKYLPANINEDHLDFIYKVNGDMITLINKERKELE